MLKEQQTRTRLLGPDVAAILRALRGARPDDIDLDAAEALLTLAHAGRDDAAFEAMAHPQGFPALLADLSRTDAPTELHAMATLAIMVNAGHAEQASGWFYKAVALTLADDPQAAIEAAHHAQRLDAGQVPGWLGLLVELAQRHPSVISLSQALTEAPPSGP